MEPVAMFSRDLKATGVSPAPGAHARLTDVHVVAELLFAVILHDFERGQVLLAHGLVCCATPTVNAVR